MSDKQAVNNGANVSERLGNLSPERMALLKRIMEEHKALEDDNGQPAGETRATPSSPKSEPTAASSNADGNTDTASPPGHAESDSRTSYPPPGDTEPQSPFNTPPGGNPWAAFQPPGGGGDQNPFNLPPGSNPWAAFQPPPGNNPDPQNPFNMSPGGNPWAAFQPPSGNNPDPQNPFNLPPGSNPWAAFQPPSGNPDPRNPFNMPPGGNPWMSIGMPWGGGFPPPGGPGFPGSPPPEPPFGAGYGNLPPFGPIVGLKPDGSRPPFFLVHAVFGSVFPYHRLAMHMDPEQPVYGIQSIGLDGVTKPQERIEDMAELYIEHIRRIQPEGPYNLGGYSFGGWVAYEMARLLVSKYKQPAGFTAILGVGLPLGSLNPVLMEEIQKWLDLAEDYMRLMVNTSLSDQQRVETGSWDPTAFMTPLQKVAYANNLAQLRYAPPPYAGSLDLLVTEDLKHQTFVDPTMGWRLMAADGVTTHLCTGNHISTFQEPHVKDLAEKLTACLARQDAGE
ncbi:MAG: thioesterase domain-containing protein [Acidobacteriota bacterium]|nr:thioesterase domain-containing protein [Acidobacteriota bacterium]